MNYINKKIIFFGTPDYAAETLIKLLKNKFNIACVVTQPDRPSGRNQKITEPPVKTAAKKLDIQILQPEKVCDVKNEIKKINPELGILFAYGEIIPQKVIDLFPIGILNIHPSLLPKLRGPSPVQTAILNGDAETGVSIIKLDNKMDHGPILKQKSIKILDNENADLLHERLAKAGIDLLIEILPDYFCGKVKLENQDDKAATYTKKFNKNDGLIDWARDATEIYNKFRAFFPWPGIFTYLGNRMLKIANLAVLDSDFKQDLPVGQIFLTLKSGFGVKCGNGAVELLQVQPESKKQMSGADFIRGYKEAVGKNLK